MAEKLGVERGCWWRGLRGGGAGGMEKNWGSRGGAGGMDEELGGQRSSCLY